MIVPRGDDIRFSNGTILVNVVMKGSVTRKCQLSIKAYRLNRIIVCVISYN